MQIDPIELGVEIDRSPDEVFDYIRDFTHGPEWQFDAIEVVPEQARLAQVGTRIHNKRKTPFGAQSFTLAVVEVDETARRVRDMVVDGMFAGTTTTMTVDPHGATSMIRMRMVPELNGVVAVLGHVSLARSRIHRTLDHGWSRKLAQLAALLSDD